MAQVLMVSGDIGGAKIQLPVYKKLIEQGISARVVVDADPEAKAGTVWKKAGVPFEGTFPSAKFEDGIRAADVIFAGSCATAFSAEYFAIARGKDFNRLTVIGSDVWFNHARKYWRSANPDFWLAIDEVHQKDILKLRPNWLPDRVPILGQPAFDNLPTLIANKKQIREDIRAKLGILDYEEVLLYWSPSEHRDRCTEGFVTLIEGIRGIHSHSAYPAIIPRIHPKLKQAVGEEYDHLWREIIVKICKEYGCRLVWADNVNPQELNLAADVVLSQWSSKSFTSAICGVPTVNVLLPEFRDFLENELGQKKPYLPTLKCGAALGVFSLYSNATRNVEDGIDAALDVEYFQETIAPNAQKMMPSGNSAEQIAEFLASLL